MRLAEQWEEIAARLPDGWSTASLSLSVSEESDPNRAALMLASLAPGRMGSSFRLQIRPDRNPAGIFRRLDGEGIRGLLAVIGSDAGTADTVAAEPTCAAKVDTPEEVKKVYKPDWRYPEFVRCLTWPAGVSSS